MSKKKCNDTHKNHKFKLVPNYAYFTGHGALIKNALDVINK